MKKTMIFFGIFLGIHSFSEKIQAQEATVSTISSTPQGFFSPPSAAPNASAFDGKGVAENSEAFFGVSRWFRIWQDFQHWIEKSWLWLSQEVKSSITFFVDGYHQVEKMFQKLSFWKKKSVPFHWSSGQKWMTYLLDSASLPSSSDPKEKSFSDDDEAIRSRVASWPPEADSLWDLLDEEKRRCKISSRWSKHHFLSEVYGDPKKAKDALIFLISPTCQVCAKLHEPIRRWILEKIKQHSETLFVIRHYPSDALALKLIGILWSRSCINPARGMQALAKFHAYWLDPSSEDACIERALGVLQKEGCLVSEQDLFLDRLMLKKIFEIHNQDQSLMGIKEVPKLFYIPLTSEAVKPKKIEFGDLSSWISYQDPEKTLNFLENIFNPS